MSKWLMGIGSKRKGYPLHKIFVSADIPYVRTVQRWLDNTFSLHFGMMLLLLAVSIAAVGLLCLSPPIAYSQEATPLRDPIILWVAGDLWEADASHPSVPPVQRTFDGTITRPTINPNSRTIAYRVLAPVAREALARLQTSGATTEFELPNEIYT